MRKAVRIVLAIALSVSTLGVLSGCFGPSAEASIKNIAMSQQSTSNVTQDNYAVNFTQTTAEWVALSDDKKIELATLGYNKAVEQLEANSSSNFNITGMTSKGGDGTKSEIVFMLNHENSTLSVFSGEYTGTKPNLVREVEVKYPLS